VKKNIAATIPREIRIPLKIVGRSGWINDGSAQLVSHGRVVFIDVNSRDRR
jgi:hypothetical protein